ncbi:SpoIIE family protein phosphatase [Blastococcus sp. SYSU D01042]
MRDEALTDSAPRPSPGRGGIQGQAAVVAAATAVAPLGDSGSLLPAVLGDTPTAVLLINRADGLVTFANRAAIELAGDVGLPIGVDAWGSAAGLTDLSGRPLAGTDAPLSRVADGHPVAGEPVRLQPRRSDDTDRAAAAVEGDDKLLWVTGFPLRADRSGEPVVLGAEPDDDQHRDLALVVFLPVAEGQLPDGAGATEDPVRALREQAIVATDICFAITDPHQPDNPLVWVNPAFTRVTGYSLEESVGRNCRFLQGPQSDPLAVARIREAIEERRPARVTLLNYRADGTAFWNQLSLTPVFDGQGELISFVGVQSDVTARVSVERERREAFAAERRARETSQAAERRLQLMAQASSTLTGTLEVDALLARLADLCVPALAECAFVARIDDDQTLTSTTIRLREGLDGAPADPAAVAARFDGRPLTPRSPGAEAVRTGRHVVVPDTTSPDVRRRYPEAHIHALGGPLGLTSLVAIPLRARGRTTGILVLAGSEDAAFPDSAVDLLLDLAGRASLALDNARLYQGQRSVAETLQRVLLAQLPDLPGIEVAAHYESASSSAAVGGDFYDLLALPDGSIGISIGDVVGHDIDAAATMGTLRTLLRTTAYDTARPDPADVLDRVDELMGALAVPGLATLAHAHAHPPQTPGGDWLLQVANAGHPPLALRTPDGAVRLLTEARGRLLGVGLPVSRSTTPVVVPAGSLLVTYTDGLVERHDADLDRGLARLVETLSDCPVDAGVQDVCSALMPLADQPSDDVAVMVVRLG